MCYVWCVSYFWCNILFSLLKFFRTTIAYLRLKYKHVKEPNARSEKSSMKTKTIPHCAMNESTTPLCTDQNFKTELMVPY